MKGSAGVLRVRPAVSGWPGLANPAASPAEGCVLYADHIEEHGKEFFLLATERGLEGIVAKDKQSPYVGGRATGYWLKIKNPGFQRKEPVEFKVTRQR